MHELLLSNVPETIFYTYTQDLNAIPHILIYPFDIEPDDIPFIKAHKLLI